MLFWYYLTENIKVYIDGIWSVTKKPVHLEQLMEKNWQEQLSQSHLEKNSD